LSKFLWGCPRYNNRILEYRYKKGVRINIEGTITDIIREKDQSRLMAIAPNIIIIPALKT